VTDSSPSARIFSGVAEFQQKNLFVPKSRHSIDQFSPLFIRNKPNERTSYDAAKKQHWLSVYKHELLGRYPLHQGEGEWACQMERYMMRTTVDRMVERIAAADRKSETGLVSS